MKEELWICERENEKILMSKSKWFNPNIIEAHEYGIKRKQQKHWRKEKIQVPDVFIDIVDSFMLMNKFFLRSYLLVRFRNPIITVIFCFAFNNIKVKLVGKFINERVFWKNNDQEETCTTSRKWEVSCIKMTKIKTTKQTFIIVYCSSWAELLLARVLIFNLLY